MRALNVSDKSRALNVSDKSCSFKC